MMQIKRTQDKEKCKNLRHTPQITQSKNPPKIDDFGTLYLVRVQMPLIKMNQSGPLILMVTKINMKLY